jgi:hypothetical protein
VTRYCALQKGYASGAFPRRKLGLFGIIARARSFYIHLIILGFHCHRRLGTKLEECAAAMPSPMAARIEQATPPPWGTDAFERLGEAAFCFSVAGTVQKGTLR